MKHISNMSFKWINTVYNSDRRETTVVQTVKNPPAMCETWVRSLGWEDPLEEGMVTHSSILPGEALWTEELGRLQSMGLQRIRHD